MRLPNPGGEISLVMGATARQCLFVSLFYHLCASASRRDALSTGYEKRYARPPEASVMLFCAQHQSRIKAARSIVYVGTELYRRFYLEQEVVSMPHAALCVLGHCRPQPLSRMGCEGVLESYPFFALFFCQNAFSGRKIAWQNVSIPCSA